jgi:hypothetical protein
MFHFKGKTSFFDPKTLEAGSKANRFWKLPTTFLSSSTRKGLRTDKRANISFRNTQQQQQQKMFTTVNYHHRYRHHHHGFTALGAIMFGMFGFMQ